MSVLNVSLCTTPKILHLRLSSEGEIFVFLYLCFELGKLIDAGDLSQRSTVIATYALCGFANPGSIGVQLATLSSMAPDRKSDFADVAFRAFVSGSMACFLTACIAGALYDEKGFIRL